jgi:hypothetical protein
MYLSTDIAAGSRRIRFAAGADKTKKYSSKSRLAGKFELLLTCVIDRIVNSTTICICIGVTAKSEKRKNKLE